MKESEIEKECMSFLAGVAQSNPNICFWKVKAGGQQHSFGKKRFCKPSTIRGFPDIHLCMYGKWVGIELKTKTGSLSPNQRTLRDSVSRAGGVYRVARSTEQFIAIFSSLMYDLAKDNHAVGILNDNNGAKL